MDRAYVVAAIFVTLALVSCGCSNGLESNQPAATDPTTSESMSASHLGPATPTTGAEHNSADSSPLATVSIRAPQPASSSESTGNLAESGLVGQSLQQIVALRLQSSPATNDTDQANEALRARDLRIVDMALDVIARTHKDAKQERFFNMAVQYLMEAELELALQQDPDHITALYEHAEALYQRDPGSQAAADAAYVVARFVFTNAQRYASQDPRWVQEYAEQARTFASRFPQNQARATTLLFKAGRSCELNGQPADAIDCFTAIQNYFPDTPQARQVTAFLRRLTLPGHTLQLAGPTLDSQFASIDDFRGHVTLIIFWTTNARSFLEHLPTLTQIGKNFPPQKVQVLSINLDTDERLVREFLSEYSIDWPVIFFSDADHRGWSNPIATYYGIMEVPQLWLVARNGRVADTRIEWHELESRIRRLLDE